MSNQEWPARVFGADGLHPAGSGFLITAGLVVTAAHVAAAMARPTVRLPARRWPCAPPARSSAWSPRRGWPTTGNRWPICSRWGRSRPPGTPSYADGWPTCRWSGRGKPPGGPPPTPPPTPPARRRARPPRYHHEASPLHVEKDRLGVVSPTATEIADDLTDRVMSLAAGP